MDLQTERRLEQFFRVLDLPVMRIEPRMEVVDPPFRLYVEDVSERLLISVTLPIPGLWSENVLQRLLELCQPERTQGIPLRGFIVSNQLVLSCSPAPEDSVEQWIKLYHMQRRLLQISMGGEGR